MKMLSFLSPLVYMAHEAKRCLLKSRRDFFYYSRTAYLVSCLHCCKVKWKCKDSSTSNFGRLFCDILSNSASNLLDSLFAYAWCYALQMFAWWADHAYM